MALFNEENKNKFWPKRMFYLLNLVASQTGMRIGKIQALRTENLKKDHIVVKHSWDRRYGLKGTKTGVERIVPILEDPYIKLTSFYQSAENTGPYFFSANNGRQPVDHKAIYKLIYRAEQIGIDKDIRLNRNLTFHSWRHYVNTQLSAKVSTASK